MSEVSYLDGAAASEPGRAYKRALLTAMDLHPGQVVLDVGCGPGTDLASLGGEGRRVIGIDHDPVMVAEASRRLADAPGVEVREGDAQALPLEDGTVDRARLDRVLQHVTRPAGVLGELHRVLRPGGLIALADLDWDTLVIDDEDLKTSRAYTRFVTAEVVRNATIGRQLARLAAGAGFAVRTVDATAVVFRDFEAANVILRLPIVAERAVAAGCLREDTARRWLGRLAGDRPFTAAFTLFTVTASH